MRLTIDTDQAPLKTFAVKAHVRIGDSFETDPITGGTVLRIIGFDSPRLLIFMSPEQVAQLRDVLRLSVDGHDIDGAEKGGARPDRQQQDPIAAAYATVRGECGKGECGKCALAATCEIQEWLQARRCKAFRPVEKKGGAT